MVDVSAPDLRQWQELSAHASSLITRAAQQQSLQIRINLKSETQKLWTLYHIDRKRFDWRDYGDIALHVALSYPPDFAYVLIYAMREHGKSFRIDPVPPILAALERLYFVRHENLTLHLGDSAAAIRESASERAARAMRIVAREISVTSFPYAAGIYRQFEAQMKPFLAEALEEFNPRGKTILSKESVAWLRTPAGLRILISRMRRLVLRALFGKE
jgi:hypothetical protein